MFYDFVLRGSPATGGDKPLPYEISLSSSFLVPMAIGMVDCRNLVDNAPDNSHN